VGTLKRFLDRRLMALKLHLGLLLEPTQGLVASERELQKIRVGFNIARGRGFHCLSIIHPIFSFVYPIGGIDIIVANSTPFDCEPGPKFTGGHQFLLDLTDAGSCWHNNASQVFTLIVPHVKNIVHKFHGGSFI